MYYTANSRLSVRIVHEDVSTAARHTEIEEQQDKTGIKLRKISADSRVCVVFGSVLCEMCLPGPEMAVVFFLVCGVVGADRARIYLEYYPTNV